jgi:hypothetical protein
MTERFLQITYRRGRAFGDYLYLPGATGEKSATLSWDDDRNLLDNPDYRGLGWPQLRWMFTAFHLGHYIPLT